MSSTWDKILSNVERLKAKQILRNCNELISNKLK